MPQAFKNNFPAAQVDWLVRSDFASLLRGNSALDQVIEFDRKQSWIELIQLAFRLSRSGYTHVYDAHANLRSFIVRSVFLFSNFVPGLGPRISLIRRPKSRVRRWLFFRFRLSTLPRPFRGAESFHRPLKPWGISEKVPAGRQFTVTEKLPDEILSEIGKLKLPVLALAPSAAWPMKRWPESHWKSLIYDLSEFSFILLGGPEDTFLEDIRKHAPDRVLNFAGRLTLAQSASVFDHVRLVIANDTGLLHVADQMERPLIALIGPTAFGYPSHKTSQTLEIELTCKPCSKDGRGRCTNDLYQRCLVDLKPTSVAQAVRKMLHP